MIKFNFIYKTQNFNIECKRNEPFKNILKLFELKYKFNISNHLLLYNGDQIKNDNLTFDELANSIDKSENKISIIVFSKEEYIKTEKEIKNLNPNSFIGKKRKLINSSEIPTIEELVSIISSLQKEIKEIKDSNFSSISLLKEEIKSLKKELNAYKEINSINKDKSNVYKLQKCQENNLDSTITINKNDKIDSNIIFAKGMIMAWFGKINNIPKNWALCDGKNGTPNLTNKFIFGVCDELKFGERGGNSSIRLKRENLPPIGCGYFSCDSHNGKWHHKTNDLIKYISAYSVGTKNGHPDDWGSNLMIDLKKGMSSSPINIMNPYYALFI